MIRAVESPGKFPRNTIKKPLHNLKFTFTFNRLLKAAYEKPN